MALKMKTLQSINCFPLNTGNLLSKYQSDANRTMDL